METIGSAVRITAVALALLSGAALAAPAVKQSISAPRVGLEDVFELTISVTDAPAGATLELPAVPGVEVLGTSEGTSVTMRGGAVEEAREYRVTLRPTREGELSIPGARLRAGAQTIEAEPSTVEVVAGSVAPPSRRSSSAFGGFGLSPQLQQFMNQLGANDPFADAFDDPFGEDFFRPSAPRPVEEGDVKLVASLDDPSVYAGEQATWSLHLLTRVDVDQVQALELPKVDGALVEDLESPKSGGEDRVVDGVPYKAFLVARKALFPTEAGRIRVPAAKLRVRTGGPFQPTDLDVSSRPLTLTATAVPPGAAGDGPVPVGRYTLTSTTEPANPVAGEPFTLRLVAQGTGDLRALPTPKLPVDGARLFAPTVRDEPSIRNGRVGGRRTFEYVAVADAAGTIDVPAVSIPYFDPKTGKHVVAATQPLRLQIAPPAQPVAQPVAAAAPSSPPVRPEASGLRDLPTASVAAVLSGLVATALVLLALRTLRKRLGERFAPARARRHLLRSARRRVATARKHQSPATRDAFYEELSLGLRDYVAAYLGSRGHGLTLDELDRNLARVNVDAARRTALVRAMRELERQRFSPRSDNSIGDVLGLADEAVGSARAA